MNAACEPSEKWRRKRAINCSRGRFLDAHNPFRRDLPIQPRLKGLRRLTLPLAGLAKEAGQADSPIGHQQPRCQHPGVGDAGMLAATDVSSPRTAPTLPILEPIAVVTSLGPVPEALRMATTVGAAPFGGEVEQVPELLDGADVPSILARFGGHVQELRAPDMADGGRRGGKTS
jgi:hypothetical protein